MVSAGTKSFFFLLLLLFSCFSLVAQQLREGDLLFCCSDSVNAITAVTSGVDDLPIDHVAVVHYLGGEDGPLYVIEAIKPEVCLTPIDTFMMNNSTVLVGRVNVDCDVAASVAKCLAMLGKPYDDLYMPGDSAVYCSELVRMSYVNTVGELIFTPIPMSFHDNFGQVTDYWINFYAQRGMPVPEGKPGTNPGELSRRSQVTIIGRYRCQETILDRKF